MIHPGEEGGCPVARTDDIVVTDAGNDTLVYDLRTHRAHSLDRYSTRVWRLCDGSRDAAAIANALDVEAEVGDAPPAAHPELRIDFVMYPLDRLGVAGLLRREPVVASRLSRRELLRRGAAAGMTLAVPAVLSVVAPSTLQSQASGCRNRTCFTDAECCALNSKCTTKAGDLVPGKCV